MNVIKSADNLVDFALNNASINVVMLAVIKDVEKFAFLVKVNVKISARILNVLNYVLKIVISSYVIKDAKKF
jgi:hypothetical protein